MTKNNTNSTLTKFLLLNVRDLLRQQTCGDAHSKVMFFFSSSVCRGKTNLKCVNHRNVVSTTNDNLNNTFTSASYHFNRII